LANSTTRATERENGLLRLGALDVPALDMVASIPGSRPPARTVRGLA
jgi:hypothetical protein